MIMITWRFSDIRMHYVTKISYYVDKQNSDKQDNYCIIGNVITRHIIYNWWYAFLIYLIYYLLIFFFLLDKPPQGKPKRKLEPSAKRKKEKKETVSNMENQKRTKWN